MTATMTTIAREVGVSVAVVSRLLREDATLRISEQRRREILETIERMGGVKKQRRARAHNVRRRRLTHTILLPCNRVFEPVWLQSNLIQTQFYRHFEDTLARAGFHLYLTFFDPGQEFDAIRTLIESRDRCDGLLITSGLINQELADLLHEHRMPHVSNDFHAERFGVNTVRANSGDGMRQVVEHFKALGHTRIGCLGQRDGYRYPLLVAAMVAAGMEIDERDCCWAQKLSLGDDLGRHRENAREAFAAYLHRRRKATALFCQNDLFALGALDAMAQYGLKPGRDFSLVGHDNYEVRGLHPVANPIITTVDSPYDLIGQRAAQLLINQIVHSQRQIVHERIPAPLIVRQTTGLAPAQ